MISLSILLGSLLIICPKYLSGFNCILLDNLLSICSSLKIELFVRWAVHGIRNIFLQQYISVASIFLLSACFIVHDSLPYVNIGNTKQLTNRCFRCLVNWWSFQILFSFIMATLVKSNQSNLFFLTSCIMRYIQKVSVLDFYIFLEKVYLK